MMDLNVLNWNLSEKEAAGRHVLNTGATIVATVVAMHFLTGEQGAGIVDNLNTIWDGIVKVATGVAGLLATLIPIYTALTAKKSAEPASQIAAVVTNLSAPQITQAANAVADPGGRNKLISAVAGMGEVRGIVAPLAVVQATESPKVVNTPAEVSALPLAVTPKVGA